MEKLDFKHHPLKKAEFAGYYWDRADPNKLLDDGNVDPKRLKTLNFKQHP